MEYFGDTNAILFAHAVACDLVFCDLAKAQQLYEELFIPPGDVIEFVETANHSISVIV